jgi:hypothetical protein
VIVCKLSATEVGGSVYAMSQSSLCAVAADSKVRALWSCRLRQADHGSIGLHTSADELHQACADQVSEILPGSLICAAARMLASAAEGILEQATQVRD